MVEDYARCSLMPRRTLDMAMTAHPLTGGSGWRLGETLQVSGLGRRLSGTGVQVQIQVPGLIPDLYPYLQLRPVIREYLRSLSFSNRQPLTASRLNLIHSVLDAVLCHRLSQLLGCRVTSSPS
jgi:hypothetical protein